MKNQAVIKAYKSSNNRFEFTNQEPRIFMYGIWYKLTVVNNELQIEGYNGNVPNSIFKINETKSFSSCGERKR